MKQYTVELILTGGKAGFTGVLLDTQFVNGVGKFSGTVDAVKGRTVYMGRRYQAYPKGSRELKDAQARDKEYKDGLRGEVREAEKVGNPNPVPHRPAGVDGLGPQQGAQDKSAASVAGPEESGAGGAGVLPIGSGHGDAGVHSGQQQAEDDARSEDAEINPLTAAILALDPLEDSNWTDAGLPAIAALAKVLSDNSLTRQKVTQALPDYDRETALNMRVEAESPAI